MGERIVVTYTLKEVKEGFVSRCSINPKATAFGKTREEAGDNLIRSIQEYLEVYPEKRSEFVDIPMKEIWLN